MLAKNFLQFLFTVRYIFFNHYDLEIFINFLDFNIPYSLQFNFEQKKC